MHAFLSVHSFPLAAKSRSFTFANPIFIPNAKLHGFFLNQKVSDKHAPPSGEAEVLQLCTCKLRGGGVTPFFEPPPQHIVPLHDAQPPDDRRTKVDRRRHAPAVRALCFPPSQSLKNTEALNRRVWSAATGKLGGRDYTVSDRSLSFCFPNCFLPRPGLYSPAPSTRSGEPILEKLWDLGTKHGPSNFYPPTGLGLEEVPFLSSFFFPH